MKAPIKLSLPKCNQCGDVLEPRFTTEKEDGDDSKPKVLIMFGKCDKCKIIIVCDVVQTKDIPSFENLK